MFNTLRIENPNAKQFLEKLNSVSESKSVSANSYKSDFKLRSKYILRLVATNGFISVSDIADCFKVSEMTIRRDFDKIECLGLIRRTHGGAIGNEEVQIEINHKERLRQNVTEKDRIGEKSASLVQDNQNIFIGSGTTTRCIIKYILDRKNLRIITNSMQIHHDLKEIPSIELVCTGGSFLPSRECLLGPIAVDNILKMNFHAAFLGAGGFNPDDGQFSEKTFEEVPLKKAVLSVSKKTVMMIDNSKFGSNELACSFSINEINYLITNELPINIKDSLNSLNPKCQILLPKIS